MMVFGCGALGGGWVMKVKLQDGMGAFIKGPPESSLTPSAMWGHGEKMVSLNQEEGIH